MTATIQPLRSDEPLRPEPHPFIVEYLEAKALDARDADEPSSRNNTSRVAIFYKKMGMAVLPTGKEEYQTVNGKSIATGRINMKAQIGSERRGEAARNKTPRVIDGMGLINKGGLDFDGSDAAGGTDLYGLLKKFDDARMLAGAGPLAATLASITPTVGHMHLFFDAVESWNTEANIFRADLNASPGAVDVMSGFPSKAAGATPDTYNLHFCIPPTRNVSEACFLAGSGCYRYLFELDDVDQWAEENIWKGRPPLAILDNILAAARNKTFQGRSPFTIAPPWLVEFINDQQNRPKPSKGAKDAVKGIKADAMFVGDDDLIEDVVRDIAELLIEDPRWPNGNPVAAQDRLDFLGFAINCCAHDIITRSNEGKTAYYKFIEIMADAKLWEKDWLEEDSIADDWKKCWAKANEQADAGFSGSAQLKKMRFLLRKRAAGSHKEKALELLGNRFLKIYRNGEVVAYDLKEKIDISYNELERLGEEIFGPIIPPYLNSMGPKADEHSAIRAIVKDMQFRQNYHTGVSLVMKGYGPLAERRGVTAHNIGDRVYVHQDDFPSLFEVRRNDEFFEMFLFNLCHASGADLGVGEWLLAWLADLIQMPSAIANTMPIFTGGSGTGKGLQQNTIASLFGDKFSLPLTPELVNSEFNGFMAGVPFLFVEEMNMIYGPKHMEVDNKIKNFITAKTLMSRQMRKMAVPVANVFHCIGGSNHSVPTTVSMTERRMAVFKGLHSETMNCLGATHEHRRKWWMDLHALTVTDEYKGAVLWGLGHFDKSDWVTTEIPEGDWLDEAKGESALKSTIDNVPRFLSEKMVEVATNGVDDFGLAGHFIKKTGDIHFATLAMFNSYIAWKQTNNLFKDKVNTISDFIQTANGCLAAISRIGTEFAIRYRSERFRIPGQADERLASGWTFNVEKCKAIRATQIERAEDAGHLNKEANLLRLKNAVHGLMATWRSRLCK